MTVIEDLNLEIKALERMYKERVEMTQEQKDAIDEFIKLNVTAEFKEMFEVVIQLGAILASVILFWSKIWPCTN